MPEDLIYLKDRFQKVLEAEGVGSERLSDSLVSVVADLARTLRDEASEPAETDWQKGFESGWDEGMNCLLAYCV